MKLAIVRQKYTPFGGAERFVERSCDVLARLGGACIAEDAFGQDLLEGNHGRVAEIDLPRLLEPLKRVVAGRFADAVGI